MEHLSAFRLILKWFNERKSVIIVFILFGIIVTGTAMLYHIQITPLLYGICICAFIGICLGIRDCVIYILHYNKIYTAYINSKNTLDLLPEEKNLSEISYQALLKHINDDRLRVISEASQSKAEMSDYYTLWAHQIKTPISAIHLLLSSEKLNRYAVEGELFKIEQYTEMVLHYLRLESISNDMVLKKYNLYNIVCQALKKYSICFSASGLSLDFQEFECTVITDEKWMTVVVEQLLSNCIKYTKSGGIAIKSENCRLIISDTGIGISSEDLPRIFERGFTGYNGRMYKKSTGIGLFLCRRITQQLGHTISVTSKIGTGTEFVIDFSAQIEYYKNESLKEEM